MRPTTTRHFAELAIAVTLLAPGCSSLFNNSTTSSYVIINSLEASTGREPDKLSGVLNSDVLTFVKQDVGGSQQEVATIFADNLVATFSLGLKDPGSTDTPTKPSTTNFVTITRYHVQFVRSDGRAVEGVDVPYAFDGAVTITVTADAVKATMTLVRDQAKSEAPLKGLIGAFGPSLSTIAQVTFYGKDQTGRDVTVTGSISVNFADWGDPA